MDRLDEALLHLAARRPLGGAPCFSTPTPTLTWSDASAQRPLLFGQELLHTLTVTLPKSVGDSALVVGIVSWVSTYTRKIGRAVELSGLPKLIVKLGAAKEALATVTGSFKEAINGTCGGADSLLVDAVGYTAAFAPPEYITMARGELDEDSAAELNHALANPSAGVQVRLFNRNPPHP